MQKYTFYLNDKQKFKNYFYFCSDYDIKIIIQFSMRENTYLIIEKITRNAFELFI